MGLTYPRKGPLPSHEFVDFYFNLFFVLNGLILISICLRQAMSVVVQLNEKNQSYAFFNNKEQCLKCKTLKHTFDSISLCIFRNILGQTWKYSLQHLTYCFDILNNQVKSITNALSTCIHFSYFWFLVHFRKNMENVDFFLITFFFW